MNHVVRKLDGLTLVGLHYSGKNENQEIAALWQVFMKRYMEVKNINSTVMYGLCYEGDQPGDFGYLAAVPVSSVDEIPEGMAMKKVPPRTYAVFEFNDELPKMGEFWNKIYREYAPENQLDIDYTSMSFELYDERFPESGICEICVPLK